MNELPPFWGYMSDEDRGMWANPHLRQPLTQKYNDPRIIEMIDKQRLMASFPRGGMLETDMPQPQPLGNDMQYTFPRDQGLLNYGTRRGDGLPAGEYNRPYDYPQNAPNTPEQKQMYNFLRFNNFGGGI